MNKNCIMGLVNLPTCKLEDLNIKPYSVFNEKENKWQKKKIENESSEIGGFNSPKQYFRVKASVFKNAFLDIKNNPDSGYITPYNEVIKEGISPKNIGVLIKKTKSSDNERVACQILNFYGVNTPIYLSCTGRDNFIKSNDKASYSVSVDFLSGNQEFKPFTQYPKKDFGSKEIYFYETDKAMEYITTGIVKVIESPFLKFKNIGAKRKDEIIDKIREDFVMSMLVRKLILNDLDFCDDNVGMLIDYENKSIKLVNIDYEFCGRSATDSFTISTISKYFEKEFPEAYAKFIAKSHDLLNNINKENGSIATEFFGDFYNVIKSNLTNSLNYDKIKSDVM